MQLEGDHPILATWIYCTCLGKLTPAIVEGEKDQRGTSGG
jgi:hypothetical protein